MEKDFVNGTFITLGMDQRRIAEAQAFCDRLIAEAPYDEIRAIAYKNLSELHFFFTGNGMAARAANEAGLAILDNNMDLVFHSKHFSVEIMKRVYSDLCEQIRPLSLSIDEYEKYAFKCKRAGIRDLSATERNGLKVIEDMRNRGIPWKEDIFGRVGGYINNNKGQSGFGQVASILSVVFENCRSLELNRDDLNVYSIPAYVGAILNLVVDHYNTCLSRREKPDFDNYRFIIERAIQTLDDCKKNRLADPVLIEMQKDNFRNEVIQFEQKAQSAIGSIPRPAKNEIDEAFPERMKSLENECFFQDTGDSFSCQFCGHPNSRQSIVCTKCNKPIKNMPRAKIPPGCIIPMMLVPLGVAGYFWYTILITKSSGFWSWMLAIVCSLMFFNTITTVIKNRSK